MTIKPELMRQLIRFAVVGALVAGVHSLLIWLFTRGLGWGPRASFWAGYFPAVSAHFALTKWWTFKCTRSDMLRQLRDYAIASALSAALQFISYHFSLVFVTSNANLAYLIAAVVGMGLSFVLMQRRVFGAARPPAGKS